MNTKTNILIVDDDLDVLQTAKMFLKQEFSEVQIEQNPEQLEKILLEQNPDVILLDMNYSKGDNDGEEGLFWLSRILEMDPSASVIMITAYGEIDLAVQAIKKGAIEFVLKPWKNEKLLATILSAIELRKSKLEVERLRNTQQKLNEGIHKNLGGFIGNSPAMQRVFDLIDKVAVTDANVLILGENGTGKELVARALHKKSLRNQHPFVNVDLGAISESLFESELFGHVKGAFTDAKEDRPGSFEMASQGTLFLDEIGNLSMSLQVKLLTALQNREIRRVGSNNKKEIDIRLICATNMPLYNMVGEKKFRQDLLYRINTVEITLPPLRERIEDIPLLAEHFINIYTTKYKKDKTKIDKQTMSKLQQYHWPGNVRELQHAIERAIILNEGKSLQARDFFPQQRETQTSEKPQPITLDEMEEKLIRKSMQTNQGNMSKVAKELGITRATLYRKLEKYGI
ncbi:sigma-54 dependent transcriptional regulator [Fulvivirgaceae bacterium BMA10]|uniref:Sigma-54 dependent transcriptional regulator n=1 Tax=Splendidivirga corallicola TaxID=3051826 RepID=A0ABT8KYY6_9BACT|nr:sigma-54 dependent transcriptional regulator [Fulvivirgaceae bacterium BMA10]